MKCVNVTGNTVLASVVSWLRSALNFQPEQCYEVANPDEIPSVPIAGHWWCTVAGGDGQFVEGNQDASQCSEQTEVIVTAYTRIQTDMTDHAENLLHDPARGCFEMKRRLLKALCGVQLVTPSGDLFLRQSVWASRSSPPRNGKHSETGEFIGMIQLAFRIEFDWDLS